MGLISVNLEFRKRNHAGIIPSKMVETYNIEGFKGQMYQNIETAAATISL